MTSAMVLMSAVAGGGDGANGVGQSSQPQPTNEIDRASIHAGSERITPSHNRVITYAI